MRFHVACNSRRTCKACRPGPAKGTGPPLGALGAVANGFTEEGPTTTAEQISGSSSLWFRGPSRPSLCWGPVAQPCRGSCERWTVELDLVGFLCERQTQVAQSEGFTGSSFLSGRFCRAMVAFRTSAIETRVPRCARRRTRARIPKPEVRPTTNRAPQLQIKHPSST